MKPLLLANDRLAGFGKSLPESPHMTIPKYWAMKGLAKVYIDSLHENFIVQSTVDPSEPIAFGEDIPTLLKLMARMQRWNCINVAERIADELALAMAKHLQCPIKTYGDMHFVHDTNEREYRLSQAKVRPLSLTDAGNVEAFGFVPAGHLDVGAALASNSLFGAFIGHDLVSICYLSAKTDRYVDLGVETRDTCRNQGYSTATAYLAIQAVLAEGLTPIWSTGEDNYASLRVAEKLGFSKVQSRTYLIPQPDR